MPGDGKIRDGMKRFSIDLEVDDERFLRTWAAEADMTSATLVRRELLKIINRKRALKS